ncbi:MAG: DNA replication/repair protein RecF [Pseudomonadota bacterium]|nr:DNA replication/repair protein RecF [Pseudomonadota bacterium]
MTAVTRLALTDFRNHRDALIELGAGFVLLSGPNGAGKTNVLEAVSLLTPGRGLRQVPISEMARGDGPGGWAVAAQLAPSPQRGEDATQPPAPQTGGTSHGEGAPTSTQDCPAPNTLTLPSRLRERGIIAIGTGTSPSSPDRRQMRINGAPASVNSLSEWLSVLWLTPAMDRLFTESAGGRRRFLDRLTLALEPGHAHHAARYEAAMRSRNKLLAEPSPDLGWLAALEAHMAEHGEAVGDARARTVEELTKMLAARPGDDFPRATLELEGWQAGDLAATLERNRSRDAAAGRTMEGPHRQDLIVTHVAKAQPAARSSTGEQKALLLGLVLAHAELVTEKRGQPPILLLDEVAAHLDPCRRNALFSRLDGRGQIWMTATEAALFGGIEEASTRFHVESGTIFPA